MPTPVNIYTREYQARNIEAYDNLLRAMRRAGSETSMAFERDLERSLYINEAPAPTSARRGK